MENINYIFLEEYKQLDKLLREMQYENGVTDYIDQMKERRDYNIRFIPSWNADLTKLHSLRHARNKLTHDVGTLDLVMCVDEDIEWLRDFRKRLMDCKDPLTKLNRPVTTYERTSQIETQYYQNYNRNTRHKRFSGLDIVMFLLLIVAVLIILMFVLADI